MSTTRSVFLSYSRRDDELVSPLVEDLTAAGCEVWLDREIRGGERWWVQILEQIQRCDLFVFAMSPDSIRSSACAAEATYASALRRPILPVKVRHVDPGFAPPPVAEIQTVVDLTARDRRSGIELLQAVQGQPATPPLPEPLPVPPPAPLPELATLHAHLRDATVLTAEEQLPLVDELLRRTRNEDQRAVASDLLQQLRQRSDVTLEAARRIDDALRASAIDRDPDAAKRLRLVLGRAVDKGLTPILGIGLTDTLIGSRQEIARWLAEANDFPMAAHDMDDLPSIAQFVDIDAKREGLLHQLNELVRERLVSRLTDGQPGASVDHGSPPALGRLLTDVWRLQAAATAAEPHTVLARLRLPVYVTSSPVDLMAEALRALPEPRVDPVVEVFRWKEECDTWPPSAFGEGSDYVPSTERPLVFHVHGHLSVPESLVLTEDDHIEFCSFVARNPKAIPETVQERLTRSSLLVMGLRLEAWDVRMLLHALLPEEGAMLRNQHEHLAAQVDLAEMVASPPKAKRYLEKMFQRSPVLEIFWCTVDEFAAGLDAVSRPAR